MSRIPPPLIVAVGLVAFWAVFLIRAHLPSGTPAQAQGSRDPLGDCVKDCRRRGAKEATYTGYPYPSPGIPDHTCACTFGLIEEKHE